LSYFNLLGVVIEHNLKWNAHVDSICTKTSTRLHYLKVLKRSSLSRDYLLYFCSSVIRPVLEYACRAWHTSLNQQQTRQIESIQKRALRIIKYFIVTALTMNHQLQTLAEHKSYKIMQIFF